MQPKSRLTILSELKNDALLQVLEATAKERAMAKEPDQERIIKKVMDPSTMQMKTVTVKSLRMEMQQELARRQATLSEYEAMIAEEQSQILNAPTQALSGEAKGLVRDSSKKE